MTQADGCAAQQQKRQLCRWHSARVWLLNSLKEADWKIHVVPSSQSAWLGFRRRNVRFFSPRPHQKRDQNDVFRDQLLITDKKFSFVGPLSSTEMRRCARLQGDLPDFNSFTPDYALEHLLCCQPPEHPLKDKTSQKPVQTISFPCCNGGKMLPSLQKEVQIITPVFMF